MHIPDVDWQSTVLTFRAALTEIKAWSTAHPTHTPLTFYVQFASVKESVGAAVGASNLQYIDLLLSTGAKPTTCASCGRDQPHLAGRMAL